MGEPAAEGHAARVRERAHAIWEREGRPEGGHERHWATAEDELRAEEPGRAGAPGAEESATAGDAAGADLTSTATGRSLGGVP